jgi:hypothetical protein
MDAQHATPNSRAASRAGPGGSAAWITVTSSQPPTAPEISGPEGAEASSHEWSAAEPVVPVRKIIPPPRRGGGAAPIDKRPPGTRAAFIEYPDFTFAITVATC